MSKENRLAGIGQGGLQNIEFFIRSGRQCVCAGGGGQYVYIYTFYE